MSCLKCGGVGGYTTSQNHPYGSTYATEYLWEICEYCVGQGKCPSCNGPISEDEEWTCLDPECGLTFSEAQKRENDRDDYLD